MALDIRQEEHGDVRIIALAGRLDTETAADLELALQDLQAAGATRFVVDLAEIGYVSSAGLRVLLALAKQLEGGRGLLRLCTLNDAVTQVFDVAGFSRLFAIFPDREQALTGIGPPAAPAEESMLARRAAKLLGATESTSKADPASADIARAAAQLLGSDAAGAKGGAPKPKSAPPKPAAAPAAARPPPQKPSPAQDQGGVIGKFRSLFGNKK